MTWSLVASLCAPRGSIAYVVEVYADGYEVEVSDAEGRTVFLVGVPDVDLELAEPNSA